MTSITQNSDGTFNAHVRGQFSRDFKTFNGAVRALKKSGFGPDGLPLSSVTPGGEVINHPITGWVVVHPDGQWDMYADEARARIAQAMGIKKPAPVAVLDADWR